MLKDYQRRFGLTVSEDDHVLTLRHGRRVISRYAICGIMSAIPIQKDADKYIEECGKAELLERKVRDIQDEKMRASYGL